VSVGDVIKDNVYAAGGMVTISGTVDGDVYVGGGTVNITGTVTKDVVVGAGTVIITGKIGDDLRVSGGNITIGGSVGGELLAGGGNITILPGVTVGKSTYIGGGNVSLGGTFGGDAKVSGGALVFSPGTKVSGNLDYYTQKELDLSNVKVGGEANFHEQKAPVKNKQMYTNKFPWVAFITIWSLISLAAFLILVYLMFYLWRKDVNDMISKAFAKPGRELLRGFATMFLIPIAVIILFITIIGFPLGIFALLSYIALMMLSAAMAVILGAALLARFVFRRKETELNWWLILIAAVVIMLLKLVPFVGWIINFLIMLAALGVMGNKLWSKFAPER